MLSRAQLKSLQESRRHGLGRLLLLARQDFLSRIGEGMDRTGSDPSLQARGRLLPYVDVEGTRSIDLARRMGVSKQAVARMVKDLEDDGLLCRDADEADGRASLVRFTEEGLDYLTRMHQVIEQIERSYEDLVGKRQLDVVRKVLATIAYRDAGEADDRGS